MPADRAFTVLFICGGNAARSILAESILNRVGAPRFRAFSAGVMPRAAINPRAVAFLKARGFETDGLRSKSWDEFAGPSAPKLDLVVTVCDAAANEPCPVWPGGPAAAHWSIPDPTTAPEAESEAAFAGAYALLETHIAALCKQEGPPPRGGGPLNS